MSNHFDVVALAVGDLFSKVDQEDRPTFVAFIERSVGSHYRRLASITNDQPSRSELLQAAAREDQNASALEERDPDSGERRERIMRIVPQAETLLPSLLADFSLSDQLKILAEAEHAGGELYRVFAAQTNDERDRSKLIECYERERENAITLRVLADRLTDQSPP